MARGARSWSGAVRKRREVPRDRCQAVLMAEWNFTDAWLLTAVARFGTDGCSLSELIGAADALNHDIPRAEQASSSIGRLVATGLVEPAGERRFKATPEGAALYRRRAQPMFEQSRSVLRLLKRVDLVEGGWEFEPGEFDAAYEAHRERISRWTR